jgi:hypothetical protein
MGMGQSEEEIILTCILRKESASDVQSNVLTNDLQSIYSSGRTTPFVGGAAGSLN